MITPDMSSGELAALITAACVLVVVYNLRNANCWRSARPRLPW
jgi:hypothetical protein